MSWLGKLAGLGGLIAAPFTAGSSLAWVPAAFGAGAAVDGALDSGDDSGDGSGGDGMDLSSLWGPDGTFLGPSSVAGEDSGGGSSDIFGKLLKYGLPAIAGAIKGGQQNSQAQQQLQLLRDKLAEDTAARKQTGALDESKLDPFRGYMAQARDVGKLDLQAEGNFASSPVQADAKYGAGLNLQPEQFYTPSATMRGVARGARDAVARGDKVPTMTDPANYGKMPVVNYAGDPNASAAPAGAPAGGPATAILTALRAKGLVADDDQQNQPSPWLAQ